MFFIVCILCMCFVLYAGFFCILCLVIDMKMVARSKGGDPWTDSRADSQLPPRAGQTSPEGGVNMGVCLVLSFMLI